MKLLIALCVAVSGCASNGVVMTDEDAKACQIETCAPFTEAEILKIMGAAFKDGYIRGWTDSHRQAGRTL